MTKASPSLRSFVDEYVDLERRVRERMIAEAGPCCSACTICCCRCDICEETRESVFLSLILAIHPPREEFSDSYGWLVSDGCLLDAGRPPVCYEFLCDTIMRAMPSDATRYALRVLGALMAYVGNRALGPRHLVEIQETADLLRIKPERLLKRIGRAREALDAVITCLETGQLSGQGKLVLSRIHKPGADLYQGM